MHTHTSLGARRSVRWDDIYEPVRQEYRRWPWRLVGVFPTEDNLRDDPESGHRNAFAYTVGGLLGHGTAELYVPWCSIEGRCADIDLIAPIANTLCGAMRMGLVREGDDVLISLGIADPVTGEWLDDAEAVFWVGSEVEDTDHRYETNMSPYPTVIPVRWTSPLGWPE